MTEKKIVFLGDGFTAGVMSDGYFHTSFLGFRQFVGKRFNESYSFATPLLTLDELEEQIRLDVQIEDINFINQSRKIIVEDNVKINSVFPLNVENNFSITEAIKNSNYLVLSIGPSDLASTFAIDNYGKLDYYPKLLDEKIKQVNKRKVDIFKIIKKINPDITIFDIAMYFPFPHLDKKQYIIAKDAYNIIEAGIYKDIPEFDVYKVELKSEMNDNISDFIDNPLNSYPNASGHMKIANCILDCISRHKGK